MRLFTSGPKPLARISEKVVCQSLSSPWRGAVAQAVEAGQIGGGLAHGDDVVGGQSIAGMGQADLLPGCAQALQGVNGVPDRLLHILVHSLAEVLPGNADLQAGDAVLQARQIAAALSLSRGGIPPVVPGYDLHEKSGILYGMGKRADLLQGVGIGHQAVARDQAVGGLESHDAAKGCRTAH